MAQLKENSTVTKNSQQNLIWHNAYEKILTTDIVPVESLSDNFTELSVNGKIQSSDVEEYDYFGSAVACSDNRIVIGAWYEDTTFTEAGSAYIFDINGNEIKKIQSSDIEAYDRFGYAVGCSENRIVVGSQGKNASTGAAYIFDINGNELAKIQASDGQASDYFGSAVAVSDNRIVVGAYGDDLGADLAGSAYIFDINGNQIAKIRSSDIADGDYFGYAVACSDTRIVVGAYHEDTGGNSAGSAYIFDINGNEIAKIQASDVEFNNYFGSAVACSENRIVVGAYGKNASTGAAYVFDINGNEIAKIQASDGGDADYFAKAVTCSNTRIVVGASSDDDAGGDAGAAYIFDINGNELTKITASNGGDADQFGASVDVSNTRIVVGARNEDTTALNAGAAYIFNNFRNDLTEIISTVYNQTGIEFKVQG